MNTTVVSVTTKKTYDSKKPYYIENINLPSSTFVITTVIMNIISIKIAEITKRTNAVMLKQIGKYTHAYQSLINKFMKLVKNCGIIAHRARSFVKRT